jgi:hypothetical protein
MNMLDRNQLPYDERKREESWGIALKDGIQLL